MTGSIPNCLWACKGGGGNFGVVTTFEFTLHPVGPLIVGGLLAWPADQGPEVARRYRDMANDAPPEFGSGLVVLTGPPEEFVPPHLQGQPIVAVAVTWTGEESAGADLVQILRDLKPAIDLVGPIPYVQMQSMLDDPPGLRQYWSADYHDAMPDEALEVFLAAGAARPSPLTQHLMLPWGGVLGDIAADSTPLSQRSAAWVSHPFATWEDAADDAANIGWVRDYRTAVAPFTTGGTYLNFIGDEGQGRIAAAFGEHNLSRLREVKGEYDPENVFAGNQNIRPTVPV